MILFLIGYFKIFIYNLILCYIFNIICTLHDKFNAFDKDFTLTEIKIPFKFALISSLCYLFAFPILIIIDGLILFWFITNFTIYSIIKLFNMSKQKILNKLGDDYINNSKLLHIFKNISDIFECNWKKKESKDKNIILKKNNN